MSLIPGNPSPFRQMAKLQVKVSRQQKQLTELQADHSVLKKTLLAAVNNETAWGNYNPYEIKDYYWYKQLADNRQSIHALKSKLHQNMTLIGKLARK
jgi:hypothetical protein